MVVLLSFLTLALLLVSQSLISLSLPFMPGCPCPLHPGVVCRCLSRIGCCAVLPGTRGDGDSPSVTCHVFVRIKACTRLSSGALRVLGGLGVVSGDVEGECWFLGV